MKLRAQLALSICLTTLVLLVVAGILIGGNQYGREMLRFNQKLAYNRDLVPRLLRIPLWNIDIDALKASVQALFVDKDINRITLLDPQGTTVAEALRVQDGGTVAHRLEIRENGFLLGTVELVYSLGDIERSLASLVMSYSIGGLLLLLTIGTLIMVSMLMITRPLAAIIDALAKTGSGEFGSRLEIKARGELKVLVSAVNAMMDDLQERERTIVAVTAESARNEVKFLVEQEQRLQSDALRAELQLSLESLRKAQDQLINVEKMAVLGGLVAGVAHEINTPLGIGVTAASFLVEQVGHFQGSADAGDLTRSALKGFIATVGESSRLILNNLQRAAELIRSFKQVSVDQTSEQRRSFGVAHYLGEVISSLHPQLKKTAVEVNVDCPDGLVINSYPGAFAQIVTNLVMNSLIHGFHGRDRGRIDLSVRLESGNELAIDYRDDGAGMADEALHHLFEPFYTSLRNEGGSGLGTYIIYNLVTQRFGGSVRAESGPGRGLAYRIRFPVSPVDPGSAA